MLLIITSWKEFELGHQHFNSIQLGSGKLIIDKHELEVVSASIFLHFLDIDDEQRVCLSFPRPVDAVKVAKAQIFAKFILDKPKFSGSHIPVMKLSLFTLSAWQDSQTQIDFLVSPREKRFDEALHPRI